MIRKTLTILSLIGLLLSVGLWGVSYWNVMYFTQDEFLISLSHGALQLGDFKKVKKWRDLPYQPPGLTIHGWQWGFTTYWYRPRIQINSRTTNVVLPFWIPTLVFGPSLAFLCLPAHRRRKRKKLGLCVTATICEHRRTGVRSVPLSSVSNDPQSNNPIRDRIATLCSVVGGVLRLAR